MKLAVTATQAGLTSTQFQQACLFMIENDVDEFHHGGCIGGDDQLQAVVKKILDNPRVIMHRGNTPEKWADCDKNADEIREPDDNIARNHTMVEEGDVLLACPGEQHEVIRSGTWATIRYAVNHGVRVYIFYPDGTTETR